MADQPYQFGDVVDGYRWTITGWEPVEPVERTVGVPRLLEARYAATQQAQARQQTQTLEAEAPLVVEDSPAARDAIVEPAASTVPEPPAALASVVDVPVVEMAAAHPQPAAVRDQEPEPEPSYSLEELLGGGRRVVAAPDLAIEFDAEPVEDELDDVQAVEVDAAFDEPVEIEAAFHEPVETEALADEPVEIEAHVDEPVEIEALADEPVEIEAHVDEPVEIEALVDEPVEIEALDDEPVEIEALDDEPVEIEEQVDPADVEVAIEPWPTVEPWEASGADGAAVDREADAVTAEPEPEPEPYDARPPGMRAWYGLGIEPIEEPEPEPSPFVVTPVDDDAPFAAALALGARALAETYQPSDIEIAAGAAARQPVQTWSAPAWEPIDEWNAADASVAPPEPLDAHDLTYGSASLPEPPAPAPEPDPEPRVVTPSAPPPAGWYPGSV